MVDKKLFYITSGLLWRQLGLAAGEEVMHMK